MAKGIKPGRLRFSDEPVNDSSWSQTKPGVLIVPIYSIDSEIVNVECIDADGRKTFLHHGLLKGCFFPLGDFKAAGAILNRHGVGDVRQPARGYEPTVRRRFLRHKP